MTPYEIVFFDCDSTLSKIEGIDELGQRAGVGAELSELTNKAMNGELALEEVYEHRLRLVRPAQADLEWLGERYVEQMVDGARELIGALHELGKRVVIVSGGLLDPVLHVAKALEIAEENVHAVPVLFDDAGNFSGYVKAHPLAQSGGKAIVCRNVLAATSHRWAGEPLATRKQAMDRKPRSVFVGDGNTDLDARAVCDTVIGFGGVVAREKVRRDADHFVADASLTSIARHVLTDEELARVQRRLGL